MFRLAADQPFFFWLDKDIPSVWKTPVIVTHHFLNGLHYRLAVNLGIPWTNFPKKIRATRLLYKRLKLLPGAIERFPL